MSSFLYICESFLFIIFVADLLKSKCASSALLVSPSLIVPLILLDESITNIICVSALLIALTASFIVV